MPWQSTRRLDDETTCLVESIGHLMEPGERSEGDALFSRIDEELPSPREPDQRHAGALGDVHGERARRRDPDDDGDARGHGFLHDSRSSCGR